MKKILLSLLTGFLLLGCGGNTHADKLCGLIEKATEKMEKATTPGEIDQISEQLFSNIAAYSLTMTPQEEKELGEDKQSMEKINAAVAEFKAAQEARKKVLQGK